MLFRVSAVPVGLFPQLEISRDNGKSRKAICSLLVNKVINTVLCTQLQNVLTHPECALQGKMHSKVSMLLQFILC